MVAVQCALVGCTSALPTVDVSQNQYASLWTLFSQQCLPFSGTSVFVRVPVTRTRCLGQRTRAAFRCLLKRMQQPVVCAVLAGKSWRAVRGSAAVAQCTLQLPLFNTAVIQSVCFWQALAQAQSGALQAAPGRSLAQPNPNNKQQYFHYFEWDDNTVFELSPLREEERFQTASQIKHMGLLEHQKAWKVRRDLGTPGTLADALLQWVDAGRAAVHVAGISALVMLLLVWL